jgi:hypothetical protein
MLRTVKAARYVLPLREGSSVPALVEGDDLGLYVVKLRGAGQGPKALIAELIAGELARAAGLPVPEIVLVDLARELAESEPDPELSAPLEASAGLNLGLDFLPGSVTLDLIADPPLDATLASRLVLFDAFVMNVDRTARNPNLLSWHHKPFLIDHGAALYFHHGWRPNKPLDQSDDPFREIKAHVLLRFASELPAAAEHLRGVFTSALFHEIVANIPEVFRHRSDAFPDIAALRAGYAAWLNARVRAFPFVLEEAQRARAELV